MRESLLASVKQQKNKHTILLDKTYFTTTLYYCFLLPLSLLLLFLPIGSADSKKQNTSYHVVIYYLPRRNGAAKFLPQRRMSFCGGVDYLMIPIYEVILRRRRLSYDTNVLLRPSAPPVLCAISSTETGRTKQKINLPKLKKNYPK